MEPPSHPNDVLLRQATDLLYEIHLMRGTCSHAARALVEWTPKDEAALEQCAHLDDTLALMFRTLQRTAQRILVMRSQTGPR